MSNQVENKFFSVANFSIRKDKCWNTRKEIFQLSRIWLSEIYFNPVGMNGAWKLLYCSKLTRLHCPHQEADGINRTGLGSGLVSIPCEHQVEIQKEEGGGGRGRSQIN